MPDAMWVARGKWAVRAVAVIATAAVLMWRSDAGAAAPCAKGVKAAKGLNNQAQTAYDAGKKLEAAKLWEEAASTYPVCAAGQVQRRVDLIEASIDAYREVTDAADQIECNAPALRAARLLVRQRAALQKFSETERTAREHVTRLDQRLRALDPTTLRIAGILENTLAPTAERDLAATHDIIQATIDRFPGCEADVREYYAQVALLSFPPPATIPSCAASDDRAREDLARILTLLGGAQAGDSSAVSGVRERLADYRGAGSVAENAQARAAAAEHANDAAGARQAYLAVLDALPECDTYHEMRGRALLGALTALATIGDRAALTQGLALIDDFQKVQKASAGTTAENNALAREIESRRKDFAAALVARDRLPPPKKVPTETKRPAPNKRLITGVALTGTLSGALLLTSALLTRDLRRKGPAYMEIVDAYTHHGQNPYIEGDLCSSAASNSVDAIDDACDRYAQKVRVTIATWSLTAISAVSSVILGGLLARSSAKFRRVNLGISPGPPNFMVSGRFVF